MGINAEAAIAISFLRQNNVVRDQILSLGHPELFVTRHQLEKINDAAKIGLSAEDIKAIASEKFADLFLIKLGFTSIRSMDASDFEDADIIHDLNKPVPEELHGTIPFLYDGGTIEHVFDIATAFKNVISLLSVGGVAMFTSPANSQCGHGFYQFSPELFYRLLRANGFDGCRLCDQYYCGAEPLVQGGGPTSRETANPICEQRAAKFARDCAKSEKCARIRDPSAKRLFRYCLGQIGRKRQGAAAGPQIDC
jgi:hypothetical protein